MTSIGAYIKLHDTAEGFDNRIARGCGSRHWSKVPQTVITKLKKCPVDYS